MHRKKAQRNKKKNNGLFQKRSHDTYYKAVIRCVPVSTICDRVMVVEETPGVREGFWEGDDITKDVILVTHRKSWTDNFL